MTLALLGGQWDSGQYISVRRRSFKPPAYHLFVSSSSGCAPLRGGWVVSGGDSPLAIPPTALGGAGESRGVGQPWVVNHSN